MARTPTPDYTVVEKDGAIEIRDYGPLWVAEATTSGERQQAITEGFKILATYIFGVNAEGRRMAMTAPVTQTPHPSPAPGAEPAQADATQSVWRTRFFMPPPKPGEAQTQPPEALDDRIEVFHAPAQRIAAIRFSGAARPRQLDEKAAELARRIEQAGIQPESGPIYAYYSSPLRPPFLRRNEVMFPIAASARIAS